MKSNEKYEAKQMNPDQTLKKKKKMENAANQSLNALNGIGTGKMAAREVERRKRRLEAEANGQPAPTNVASPKIHSIQTMKQYQYESKRFADWVVENHPDVDRLAYAHKMHYDREYIQQMIDRGLAPSTIAHATSALAKLFRCHAGDIHDNRPMRRYQDFTRSRGYNEAGYAKDVRKYGDIPQLCRCTGVREIELEHLYPECFLTDSETGMLFLHLDGKRQQTKGGKTRDVVILPEKQETVRNILAHYPAGKLLCPAAPSHLDIHGIRSLYATDYYNAIARDPKSIPKAERMKRKHPAVDATGKIRTTVPMVYTRRWDGKKFDRAALITVSESLGHHRDDVVVHSYLR